MREKAKKQQEEKVKLTEEEIQKSEYARVEVAEVEARYRQEIWMLKEHLLTQLHALKVVLFHEKESIVLVTERKRVEYDKHNLKSQVFDKLADCSSYIKRIDSMIKENSAIGTKTHEPHNINETSIDHSEVQFATEGSRPFKRYENVPPLRIQPQDSPIQTGDGGDDDLKELNAFSTHIPIHYNRRSNRIMSTDVDHDVNRVTQGSFKRIDKEYSFQYKDIFSNHNYKEILREKYKHDRIPMESSEDRGRMGRLCR